MNRKTCVVLSLILSCVFCWVVLFNDSVRTVQWTTKPKTAHVQLEPEAEQKYSHELEFKLEAEEKHDLELQTETPGPSRFLYLVQTESCLPDHLDSVETIGYASACQCDVLVLSFKQICSVTPSPHIEYLFNSSTTWTTGRNLLFEVARRRGEKYLYYIFVDDDIVLEFETKQNNPWREFEDFLKRIEPAVAALDTDSQRLPGIYEAREKQGCSLKEIPEYLPVSRFDAAFNAFHCQAIGYILPYSYKSDAISWWFSQLYNEVKCEFAFRGQAVIHTKVRALNPVHRSYPRRRPTNNNLYAILNEVDAKLPEEYRGSNLLLEWKKNGLKHITLSSTLCLPPPPPHMPIKPYAHFRLTH